MTIQKYFLLCASLALSVTIAGCAARGKGLPVAPVAGVETETDAAASGVAEEEVPVFVEREIEPDPTEPDIPPEDTAAAVINIDDLLEAARAACADSLFKAADSMMKKAARYLIRGAYITNAHSAAADAPADITAPAADVKGVEDAPVLSGGHDAGIATDTDTSGGVFTDADNAVIAAAGGDPSVDTDIGGGGPTTQMGYVEKIISIYTELMPGGYRMPDEIFLLTFNQSLTDLLSGEFTYISPADSAFLARLSSKTDVTYDVPMVWNDRVRRALMSLTRTRKGVFDRWLYRAGYYLPPMQQMFADSGLPRDLAYLPIIESAFNPHAYSRAHAAGIWQFIPSTGRNYGLRQNYWIDERRDPLKSTEAAINYLRKLYGDFGDWHIALASYNCGENGMARAIRRAGGVYDYWKLTLPKETMNYVPLYLASVVIAKNPDVFEYVLQDSVIYNPDTVTVNDCLELQTIADGIDLQLDSIKFYNPHILHWCTPPDMENVRLYLPKGYAVTFNEFYRNLPDEKKTKFYRYRVQSGDNLLQIARDFRVPAEALRDINKMKNNHISAGQHLIIPIPVNESVPAQFARHMNQSERERPGARNARNRPVSPRAGKKTTYKVRTGETLYSISKLFGVSTNDLMSWNYLASPRSLKAEQTLVIYLPETSAPPAIAAQRVRGNASEHSGRRLVRQGDTLFSIAMELGLTVSELAGINGLDPKRPLIYPGDVLVYTPKTTGGNQ